MEVVPSRSYRLDVRPYQIGLDDVAKTLQFLRQNHELYYLLYKLMLEGGLRLSHAIQVVKEFRPSEAVEIPAIGLATKRLVCFEDKGFCRYYVGLRGSQSPANGRTSRQRPCSCCKGVQIDPSTEALLPGTRRGTGS